MQGPIGLIHTTPYAVCVRIKGLLKLTRIGEWFAPSDTSDKARVSQFVLENPSSDHQEGRSTVGCLGETRLHGTT